VIIAVQLGIDHWFYLYIPWFFGLVMVALLGAHLPERFGEPTPKESASTRGGASTPARSSPLAAA
jgi:hypothetical protein